MKLRTSKKWLYVAIILLIILIILFRRHIAINLVFILYDMYALYGYRWQMTPEYCSPMVNGFTPVMPLQYYAEFNKAIFPRIPKGDNTLNREEVKRICDRNLKWLKENKTYYKTPKNIAVFESHYPKFKENVLTYLKKDMPFVMRGIKLTCLKTMRMENLIEKAGNDKVYMTSTAEKTCPENIFTELKNIKENHCYVTNSTNLFSKYEDLLPDSDMDIIKDIIDGYMNNDSKQLFLSVKKGTGTALHAAYTNNFFVMIQGTKKWSFFNPNQLALIYPHFKEKGIYMASETRFINMEIDEQRMTDEFPLMKYVERYEIELQEGDILYNPRSWFHSVKNTSEISVACSTRWSCMSTAIPDTQMLRYGNMINPELRDYVKEIYINTGILGISQIDEHKHMIGETNPDAIPFWDKYTNDSHKLCETEKCSKNWHN